MEHHGILYLFFKIILYNFVIQLNWIKRLTFILQDVTGSQCEPELGSLWGSDMCGNMGWTDGVGPSDFHLSLCLSRSWGKKRRKVQEGGEVMHVSWPSPWIMDAIYGKSLRKDLVKETVLLPACATGHEQPCLVTRWASVTNTDERRSPSLSMANLWPWHTEDSRTAVTWNLSLLVLGFSGDAEEPRHVWENSEVTTLLMKLIGCNGCSANSQVVSRSKCCGKRLVQERKNSADVMWALQSTRQYTHVCETAPVPEV